MAISCTYIERNIDDGKTKKSPYGGIAMDMIEKADLLRKKANVTYAEAQAALNEAGGNLLDALVILERQGKIKGPEQTVYADLCEYTDVTDRAAAPEKSAPTLLRLIGRLIRTLILFVRFTIFKVTRREDTLITLPTALFLLLMFFFWRALLPVMLIALLFGVEYSFDGAKRTQGNK